MKKNVNYIQKNRSGADNKIIATIICVFILVLWFVSPPGNKFIQLCFWSNNARYFVTKVFHPTAVSAYKHHRNNAIYLARMYPKKDDAIKEMDKAISLLPNTAPDKELYSLYRDKAEIELFLGKKEIALSDYLKSGDLSLDDTLRVAMLLKDKGKYREALKYCNMMVGMDIEAYAGYACLADLYKTANRPDVALKVWDLAIYRNSKSVWSYVERAKVKRSLGDLKGYEEDMAYPRKFNPYINENYSITAEALAPKNLSMEIK